jgi:hypothetical protein
VSYDDTKALREFAEAQRINYPLLSDQDSVVIKQYGILNTLVSKDDAFIYGIPYPGVFVCDEGGRVVSKFFHDSYKKRESPETLIDAALGHIQIEDDLPQTSGGESGIAITAAIRGGDGSLRQGIIRQLIVRFRLKDGLHLYGAPVPSGLTATKVTILGPNGLHTLPARYPPTTPLHHKTLGVDLHVWSNEVDIVVPFYPAEDLATEAEVPLQPFASIDFEVCYQACNEDACLLPQTQRFSIELPLDVVDVPGLSIHRGHGQRESDYDSTPAMRRLIWRKIRSNPLRLLKLAWKTSRLKRHAKKHQDKKKTLVE